MYSIKTSETTSAEVNLPETRNAHKYKNKSLVLNTQTTQGREEIPRKRFYK